MPMKLAACFFHQNLCGRKGERSGAPDVILVLPYCPGLLLLRPLIAWNKWKLNLFKPFLIGFWLFSAKNEPYLHVPVADRRMASQRFSHPNLQTLQMYYNAGKGGLKLQIELRLLTLTEFNIGRLS